MCAAKDPKSDPKEDHVGYGPDFIVRGCLPEAFAREIDPFFDRKKTRYCLGNSLDCFCKELGCRNAIEILHSHTMSHGRWGDDSDSEEESDIPLVSQPAGQGASMIATTTKPEKAATAVSSLATGASTRPEKTTGDSWRKDRHTDRSTVPLGKSGKYDREEQSWGVDRHSDSQRSTTTRDMDHHHYQSRPTSSSISGKTGPSSSMSSLSEYRTGGGRGGRGDGGEYYHHGPHSPGNTRGRGRGGRINNNTSGGSRLDWKSAAKAESILEREEGSDMDPSNWMAMRKARQQAEQERKEKERQEKETERQELEEKERQAKQERRASQLSALKEAMQTIQLQKAAEKPLPEAGVPASKISSLQAALGTMPKQISEPVKELSWRERAAVEAASDSHDDNRSHKGSSRTHGRYGEKLHPHGSPPSSPGSLGRSVKDEGSTSQPASQSPYSIREIKNSERAGDIPPKRSKEFTTQHLPNGTVVITRGSVTEREDSAIASAHQSDTGHPSGYRPSSLQEHVHPGHYRGGRGRGVGRKFADHDGRGRGRGGRYHADDRSDSGDGPGRSKGSQSESTDEDPHLEQVTNERWTRAGVDGHAGRGRGRGRDGEYGRGRDASTRGAGRESGRSNRDGGRHHTGAEEWKGRGRSRGSNRNRGRGSSDRRHDGSPPS